MLILSQSVGDSTTATLQDGTEIVVTVVGIRGNQVRLAWSAPKTVSILRDKAHVREPKAQA